MAEGWMVISKCSATLSKNKRIMRLKRVKHNSSPQICRGRHKVEDNKLCPTLNLMRTINNRFKLQD